MNTQAIINHLSNLDAAGQRNAYQAIVIAIKDAGYDTKSVALDVAAYAAKLGNKHSRPEALMLGVCDFADQNGIDFAKILGL